MPLMHVVEHPIRCPYIKAVTDHKTSVSGRPSDRPPGNHSRLLFVYYDTLVLGSRSPWLCLLAGLSLLLGACSAQKENADGVKNFCTCHAWVSICAWPPPENSLGPYSDMMGCQIDYSQRRMTCFGVGGLAFVPGCCLLTMIPWVLENTPRSLLTGLNLLIVPGVPQKKNAKGINNFCTFWVWISICARPPQ